ncbi:MAG: InlB B-repeat-containing protein [Nitrososphaerota archaeon]|jgi:uncharacterized repeat protein (TIGR02543 family)|nr:InlB B-repeat-containing protein [Nitrososphaerota archaeon]
MASNQPQQQHVIDQYVDGRPFDWIYLNSLYPADGSTAGTFFVGDGSIVSEAQIYLNINVSGPVGGLPSLFGVVEVYGVDESENVVGAALAVSQPVNFLEATGFVDEFISFRFEGAFKTVAGQKYCLVLRSYSGDFSSIINNERIRILLFKDDDYSHFLLYQWDNRWVKIPSLSVRFVLYGRVPTYSVVYEGNGASGGEVPVDGGLYESGASVPVAANLGGLVRTNYVFRGWDTNSSALVPTYAVSGSMVEPSTFTMEDANVVLFAVWQENPRYTVVYEGNGSTGGSAPTDLNSPYYVGSAVTVLGNTGSLVRANYAFLGWSPNQSASAAMYTAGSTFALSGNVVLFAVWQENPKFRVTYEGNGNTSGTAPTDNRLYYQGETVTVSGNTGGLVRTGYHFLGWATGNNAVSATYVQGSTFPMSSSNVVLFAVWELIPTFRVVYDGNGSTGGSVPTDDILYQASAVVTVAANTGGLVRSGYTFRGWAMVSGAVAPEFVVSGGVVSPSTFIMPASNVVLFAVWEEDTKFSVVYNGNGATSGTAPVDPNSPYGEGFSVTVLGQGSLLKADYVFLGWSPNASASVPMYTVGQSFTIMGNMVLFAVWLADDVPPPPMYMVTYRSNAPVGVVVTGTVPIDNVGYLQGQTVNVKANPGNLATVSHTFSGWAYLQDAVTPDFVVEDSAVTPSTFAMGNVNVVLFAVWRAIPLFTVLYQPNGATSGEVPVDVGGPYLPGALVVVLGAHLLERVNYNFVGWNTDSTASTALYVPGQIFTVAEGSVVLYAIWQENPKYSVTYNGNGNTGGFVPVDGNSPYYAGALVVVLNRGSLTRLGYNFLGWATGNNAVLADYGAGDTFQIGATNVVLFAVWQLIPLTYKVMYDANWPPGSSGGVGVGSVPTDVRDYLSGATVTVQANPNNMVMPGFRFRGWAYSSDAVNPNYTVTGNTVTPSTFTLAAANVVLFAVWQLIRIYTVIYHDNNAESGLPPIDPAGYEAGASVTVKANTLNLTRTGYTFAGWSILPNQTIPNYAVSNNGFVDPATFVMPEGNVNLYPVWSAILMFTVTYNGNGHTGG